jgi:hypothetical protein
MSPRLLAVVFLSLVIAPSLRAQAASAASPLGTWRGTSLCTVRPSSCNDERVVYRVTPLASHDSVSVDARKIVNGQEEPMGALRCGLDMTRRQLTCAMPNGVWRLEARGDSLVGDLRLPNDTKFRDVRATRGH